ncbi:MAG: hypothetical protein IJX46_07810 [Clostridia bacterium]|nr:hypothetical protein [Clostridia bacterium]
MIVEFLDKLAVPGLHSEITIDPITLRGMLIIKAESKGKLARFELRTDMDDETFICGVKKALDEIRSATAKRVYDPRKDMSGLGVVPWAVVANNRLEELSRAVNAKMALLRESAMTDAERLEAFRQLAVWARELDLTVNMVLEMLKANEKTAP